LADGTPVEQLPLGALSALAAEPTLLLHLAFLTKDKVAGMVERDYVQGNRLISATVLAHLRDIGADRVFMASSGAAAFADDSVAAPDLRLYGRLKRDDEERLAAWARAEPARRVAIGRLYALSGPFINKPESYALANLILSVLAGQPAQVRAPMAVFRSYVAVREAMSLVVALLLAAEGDPVCRFDTGGEPLELGQLAQTVASVLGGQAMRPPPVEGQANRYLGDHQRWQELLAEHGLQHSPIELQVAETAAWLKAVTRLGAEA